MLLNMMLKLDEFLCFCHLLEDRMWLFQVVELLLHYLIQDGPRVIPDTMEKVEVYMGVALDYKCTYIRKCTQYNGFS